MGDQQPELLKNSGGPVFEFGPGWGSRIKNWVKKYILASECPLCRNTRYILLAGVIILLFFRPQLKSILNKTGQIDEHQVSTIEIIIQKGDSKTKLARRALAEYLKTTDDLQLSAGQKIFIETKMINFIANGPLKIGEIVEFQTEDIHNLGHESERLQSGTLIKWGAYAKRVKF